MAEAKDHRMAFKFSKRDTSTKAWWEAQDNPSVSLQLLIREEIERNGIVDKLNTPVTQQPRRGRPPKGSSEDDFEAQGNDESENAAQGSEKSEATEPAAPAAGRAEVENDTSEADDLLGRI